MKAIVFKGKDQPLTYQEVESPEPIKDQVLIGLKAAALNHRDLWIRHEQGAINNAGIILGSDGSGIVKRVGEDADPGLVGKSVIINPSLDWGNNPLVQGDAFRILGFPDNGTFAEQLLISKKYVHEKPEHLSFEEAAALPLSGLTAYRALFTKARIRPDERILITGIGGGAALWALQLALGFKAHVFVTSSSPEKIAKAIALGAREGSNYNDTDWVTKAKRATRGFDVIIDSAGGPNFPALLELAIPGGRIVSFGRTAGTIPTLSPRDLYWKQLSLYGTTMGTRDEFLSLLDFIEKRKIKPIVDETFDLPDTESAFSRMGKGGQFGKIILHIA